MSVEDTRIVDVVSIFGEGDEVHLSIADHLPWSREHLEMLQAKLNAYISFIESGEIHQAYPQSKGKRILIEIVAQHRPDETAIDYLGQAKRVVRDAGFELVYRPLPSGYAEDTT